MYGTIILSTTLLGLSSLAVAAPVWSGSQAASQPPVASMSQVASQRPVASVSKAASQPPAASITATMTGSIVSSMPAMPSYSGRPLNSSNGSPSDFKFPLSNGFPDITNPSRQLSAIEKQAGGTLSNNPPPAGFKPHPDSLTSLGFIAFNELFEVAFFTELLQNITTGVSGYGRSDIGSEYDEVVKTLTAVVAQEELHVLNANGAFKTFTGNSIQPCEYQFPVDNFMDAIGLASTFTDVVLATLPDIQTIFATIQDDGANDAGLVRGVGSVIGQEGEQNGFYRHLLGKQPPALPFLTGGARNFAFNAILQNFVVSNTCPSLNLLVQGGLNQTDVLNVLTTDFALEDISAAEFSYQTILPATASGNSFLVHPSKSSRPNYLTYINQQNKPFSVPISNETVDQETGAIKFTAPFPGKTNDLNGLTIAAITSTAGPFTSPDDVAAVTLFGPGLIEV